MKINNRKIADFQISDAFKWDYPDFADAHFSWAIDENGKELTDDELEILTDNYKDTIFDWCSDFI